MKSYTVKTRPVYDTESVALLVQAASVYKSRISLMYENKTANAKSIMGLLSLGLAEGHSVTVQTEGEDEDAAAKGIANFLRM